MHALEKMAPKEEYEDDQKVMIKKIKDDPKKYYNPRGGKINLCHYVPEFKEQEHYRNQRYFNKYGKWLFRPEDHIDKMDMKKEE